MKIHTRNNVIRLIREQFLPTRFTKIQVLIILVTISLAIPLTTLFGEWNVLDSFPFLAFFVPLFEELAIAFIDTDIVLIFALMFPVFFIVVWFFWVGLVSGLRAVFSVRPEHNDIVPTKTYQTVILLFMILVNLSLSSSLIVTMIAARAYSITNVVLAAISLTYLLMLLSQVGSRETRASVITHDFHDRDINGAQLISALFGLSIAIIIVYVLDIYQAFGALTMLSLLFYNNHVGNHAATYIREKYLQI